MRAYGLDTYGLGQSPVVLSYKERPMKGSKCTDQRSDYQLLKNIPSPWNPFVTLRLLQFTHNYFTNVDIFLHF
jgi:hypothetical protein